MMPITLNILLKYRLKSSKEGLEKQLLDVNFLGMVVTACYFNNWWYYRISVTTSAIKQFSLVSIRRHLSGTVDGSSSAYFHDKINLLNNFYM